MNAQRAPTALHQNLEIAARLRRLHHAEAVGMAGHVDIARIVAGDLQEDSRIGAALVRLPSRVLEARPETEADGGAGPVANARAECSQCLRVRRVALDIGQQRHVIAAPRAGVHTVEMALQVAGQRVVAAELARIARIGVESHAVLTEYRLLPRKIVRLLELVGQRPRLLLACLHVRLVERVDADDGAGHGCRDLPAEEFLADMPDILDPDPRDRMPRPLQRLYRLALRAIGMSVQLQIGEEPVTAVAVGRGERLVRQRNEAASLLPRALG